MTWTRRPWHALIDGTQTTQPGYAFWFKDVGWQVENRGTDPSVWGMYFIPASTQLHFNFMT
jgi:hypothetical protein